MGRLTSGPLGAYTYGNGAHVHAATAIGSAYTAAYDTVGDMTCRAPSALTTCVGTQTAAQLTYNTEGQLSNWQNQPAGTSTATFLYDGQGTRVAQQSSSGASTTTTVYAGNVEEDATTGGTTTKTAYYYTNGQRFAMSVNGTVKYLASDGLGSANATLDASGNVVANLLYAPYGSTRYSSGTMPSDRGFTGQVADSTSGLDYYGARYYDPVAGQFATGDTMLPGSGFDIWGLSRYAYVEGNPVNRVDPTGHCAMTDTACLNDLNRSDNTHHGVPGQDNPPGNSTAGVASASQSGQATTKKTNSQVTSPPNGPSNWPLPHQFVTWIFDQTGWGDAFGNWLNPRYGDWLRSAPGNQRFWRVIALFLDADAAALQGVGAAFEVSGAIVGSTVGPEGTVLGAGLADAALTTPERWLANTAGTGGSAATTVADAKGNKLGSGTLQSWTYTAIGWADPEAVSGFLVDVDTVFSDYENLASSS
jgi:RHS repeat-associated protein